MSYTRAQQGILRTTGWERGRFSNQDGAQPDTGYAASVSTPYSFWGHTNVFTVTQTQPLPPAQEQNRGIMAMSASHPAGSPIGPTSSSGSTQMAWANATIADNIRPEWHTQTPVPTDVGWTDDNEGWHSRSFRATDQGLGLYKLKLSGVTAIDPTSVPSTDTVSGDTVTAACPKAPPNAFCPTDWLTSQVRYKLGEGITAVTAQVNDLVGNLIPDPPRSWTEKVDRTSPTITSTTGSLYDDRVESDPDGSPLFRRR